nr:RecName: Full=Isoflavone reductase homolog 1 [Pseudotsuga menziesii]
GVYVIEEDVATYTIK